MSITEMILLPLLRHADCSISSLKLVLIIRSHKGLDAREKRPGHSRFQMGYTIDHGVESEKATKARYNNKGVYIVLQPPDFATPVFHSFEAITPRPKANAYYNLKM